MSQFKSKRGGKNPSYTEDGFMIDPEDANSVIIYAIVDEFGDIIGVNSKVYPDVPPRIFKNVETAMEHVIGFTHGIAYVVGTYLTKEQRDEIDSILSLGCISTSVELDRARELERISSEGIGEDTGHFIFSNQYQYHGDDAKKKYRDDVKKAKRAVKASRAASGDGDHSSDTLLEHIKDIDDERKKNNIKEHFGKDFSLDDDDED